MEISQNVTKGERKFAVWAVRRWGVISEPTACDFGVQFGHMSVLNVNVQDYSVACVYWSLLHYSRTTGLWCEQLCCALQ